MMKDYSKLNNRDKEKIVEYYYKNKKTSINNIALKLDISIRGVKRVLKESNINTRRKNRYTLNENYFDEINTQEKAYILGFIYADGFVGDEKSNNVVIAINDLELLKEFAKELDFTGDIRKTKKGGFKNSKCGYCINFSSKRIASKLRDLGLYPNKSLTMASIPKINADLIRHFIRGYFDGDGSIVLSHNTSYYKNNNKVIKYKYPTYMFDILGTKSFLDNIKIVSNFRYVKILDTKTEEIKCLRISAKKEFNNIFKYLYESSTIKLERKYNKWSEIKSAFVVGATKQIGLIAGNTLEP